MENYSIHTLQHSFNDNLWPEFIALEPIDAGCQLTLGINNNIHWLIGHFPQQAILAGVVQTHWAATLSQFIFKITGGIQQIDNLKFQEVILPEQTITLSLEFNAERNSVKFSYGNSDNKHFSEGKILFTKGNIE
jgi:3-hydroxymyristoyl/3-hydroxydecanoyl-(acyl carrier protein) dehydratase